MTGKIPWLGLILGVQPRIRLTRSFDQRQHSYLGYVLVVDGRMDDAARMFTVGIGRAAQDKHAIRAGDSVQGLGQPPEDASREAVELYKVSALKVVERGEPVLRAGPPFSLLAPALEVYRKRGHRRLAAVTYEGKCRGCTWACEMAVEMIIDQWKPDVRRHRRETFCYGPKSCPVYAAGPTRKVPGRKGMSWEEEDWVDEDAMSHRGPDD